MASLLERMNVSANSGPVRPKHNAKSTAPYVRPSLLFFSPHIHANPPRTAQIDPQRAMSMALGLTTFSTNITRSGHV